jgi:hypothetical protein
MKTWLKKILNNRLLSVLKGSVHIEHYDRYGNIINEFDVLNGITNEGKNKILNDMFNGGTQTANNSWFIGLIDNSGFSALASTDTMASHAGWTEFTTYSQAARVAWGSGSSTAQSTTNATPATFDVTGTGTIYGIFVTTNSTKGGTSGTMWSTAGFSAAVPVSSGDLEIGRQQLAIAA